jgi:hypothetical protein
MKVAWKIPLYNLVFHQLLLIQYCSIFSKKNAFQSTNNFRKIQGGGPAYPHLQERGFREGKSPSRPLIHLILRHSVRAFGTQLSPYFINWDSYFNSFWELWYRNGQVSILFNGLNVTWTRWSASAKSECKFSTEHLQCPAHIHISYVCKHSAKFQRSPLTVELVDYTTYVQCFWKMTGF